MVAYQIIRRKRNGEELSPAELSAFFQAYVAGTLPDYQMSAFLMAVYFRGLTGPELESLVDVMLQSGAVMDLSKIPWPKVDKHSTGGVGDKVSIVLAPLVACLGVAVPMMSGRGLGHTGGTVDKLESIPGFRTDLTLEQFYQQLESVGCALITQTDEIVPLDRKLYALRDVTGTVESLPLIASSIMSKKIAEGIDGLVLDIKRGNGAFLPDLERGIALAQTMIAIGKAHHRSVVALLTAMDRPLGYAVGNALEVEECILTLRGDGPPDVYELTVALAVEMVQLARGGAAEGIRAEVETALADGRALERMRRVIEAQGGNPAVLDDPALLPQAPIRRVVTAQTRGFVQKMNVRAIGEAAVALGAGRAALHSTIDAGVGFHITIKPGHKVEKDQPMATVFAQTDAAAEQAALALRHAVTIGEMMRELPLPLISHRITEAAVQEIKR